MKRQFLAYVGVAVLSAAAMLAFPSASITVTAPAIGGGYTDVTAIPVDDPTIKAIGAALFKPAGAGPFPAVVYMAGCTGIDSPVNRALQKTTTDHLLAKGVAILIVDSFTPRNEPKGVCANLGNLDGEKAVQYATRGSNDALAAVAVLKTMPEIDAKHIFLAGFSLGVARRRCSRPTPRTRRVRARAWRASSPTIRSATTASIRRFRFSPLLAIKTTGLVPRNVRLSQASPISRSSSIPASRMPSRRRSRSPSTFSGLTWSMTKRARRTRNSARTPSSPRT